MSEMGPRMRSTPLLHAAALAGALALTSGTASAANCSSGQRYFYFYFHEDDAHLSSEGAKLFAPEVVAGLDLKSPVEIVGHDDTSNAEPDAVRLSRERAQAVASALRKAGAPAKALQVSWQGASAPAVATGPDVVEPLNRRVSINGCEVGDAAAAVRLDERGRFTSASGSITWRMADGTLVSAMKPLKGPRPPSDKP